VGSHDHSVRFGHTFLVVTQLGGRLVSTNQATGGTDVSFKTRLLAGAGSLALVGSMLGVAAPAAHAQPVVIGNCQGQAFLTTIFNASGTPGSLTDQTQESITGKFRLLKNVNTKTVISGQCTGAARPSDPIGQPVLPLTPKAVSGKLFGNLSCATGIAKTVDANIGNQWPMSGKVNFTMSQLNALGKPYLIQMQLGMLGFQAGQPDVLDLAGIVLKGVNVGATVTGSIWFNPVAPDATDGAGDLYDTGWMLDSAVAAGCEDAIPGNAAITNALSGSGLGMPSGFGSIAPGLIFQFGA
jgi:hypothetical protein